MAKEERGIQKSRSFHFRKMFDINPVRQGQNFVHENGNGREAMDEKIQSRNEGAAAAALIGTVLESIVPVSPLKKDGAASGISKKDKQVSTDMELMKERFSKLLLGEDMSGGGKGVSSALALSNAITNLAGKPESDMGILDNFVEEQEFKYVSRDADESEKGIQRNDKWWLPTVKVPPNGLSEESRQFLQKQKEAVNQVLKASMAINAQILSDMEIPDNYIESLPKNGRASLGESIYKSITVEFFDPLQFLSTMDLSSEHKVLDLKNRIEASIVIWKRKMHQKDGKSTWGSAISLEKRELFEERAETILLLLKQQFPGIPQSSLEISKIQFNKDVGLSILESYSRVLESLANTVMSRIQDVLYADSLAQDPSLAVVTWKQSMDSIPSPTLSSFPSPSEEAEKLSSAAETPTSMTLSDFMGWNLEPPQTDIRKNHSAGNLQSYIKDEEEKIMTKPGIHPTLTEHAGGM
ncbi:hypothetical protein DH2020_029193 [Rehmannia glutinosa]|uniref:PRONE domain-containing protein n=1 Tax=Rehmannia glutinosa TaxID=99300 RepID=A0ABR0VPB5_REHGL